MATNLKTWINGVPPGFSFVEIAEKKHGDTKWRKVFRPSFLAFMALFIMFMLFLCNVAVNDPYIGNTSSWGSSVFRSIVLNCTEKIMCVPEIRSSERYGASNLHSIPLKEEFTKTLRREGTDTLPTGIVESTSDLELRHLWKWPEKGVKIPQNLLAMAVGMRQKSNVDKIVQKFPLDNFTVILFHYDGKVDNWTDLAWSGRAIHVMALNQTKWWFAKRFLHPDVVAKYNYVFLWDEDLGVEHFHAGRYLDIMEDEGLEISQPALHRNSSEVHHRLTILNWNVRAHRRIYTPAGKHQCSPESTGPPCTGWVEMMAPVFSRAAWKCTWHMIQNDLVHAWGLDYKLGYCAQGIRSEKVGIIDTEFVVHEGIPSLGGPRLKKTAQAPLTFEGGDFLRGGGLPIEKLKGLLTTRVTCNSLLVLLTFMQPASSLEVDIRGEIRKRAASELDIFSRRWRRAAANDGTWSDPYKSPVVPSEVRPTAVEVVGQKKRRRSTKVKKKELAKEISVN